MIVGECIMTEELYVYVKFRTSNGETKDGLRDGCVVFDEIHQLVTKMYESKRHFLFVFFK